jgi:uncharacterized protein with HEPN domain
MSRSPLELLRHIADECEFLREATPHYDREEFLNDPLAKRAFTRSLSIIGEAVWKLRRDHPEALPADDVVPWAQIAGMRHRIIHEYMETEYTLVWLVCTEEIPPLHIAVLDLLQGRQGVDPEIQQG